MYGFRILHWNGVSEVFWSHSPYESDLPSRFNNAIDIQFLDVV